MFASLTDDSGVVRVFELDADLGVGYGVTVEYVDVRAAIADSDRGRVRTLVRVQAVCMRTTQEKGGEHGQKQTWVMSEKFNASCYT